MLYFAPFGASLLKSIEIKDINNVEFMCRYCHHLYDNAFLSVKNSNLCVSKNITIPNIYDLNYLNNKFINAYNNLNSKYFNYHYHLFLIHQIVTYIFPYIFL